MAWHDGRMLALDLETTGVDVEEARIVSVALAYVGGGRDTVTLTMLVDPGVEIPAEAAEVHGITTERARVEGASPRAALAAILDELARAVEARMPCVIFNARYDLSVIDRELGRHSEPEWVEDDWAGALLVVDPSVIDRHLDRFRPGSRKLSAVCEHYGAVLDGAHEADSDAIAAARVAWRIGRRGEVRRRVRSAEDARELAALEAEWAQVRDDLPALHAAQVRWAAEQAAGLEQYFRRGNPAKDLPPDRGAVVERAWPLVPARTAA